MLLSSHFDGAFAFRGHDGDMRGSQAPFLAQVFSCWNWKCALLSATARSIVYVAALAHSGHRNRLSIVLVEIAYVALTAGVYAGMQQRALALRARWLGNAVGALGVPALAQMVDCLAHRLAGPPVPFRATLAVTIFALLSALFHQFVMRRGAFLTGCGSSLGEDFRRMPRLIVGFVAAPVMWLLAAGARAERAVESEAAL
jgi:hypothetical protein